MKMKLVNPNLPIRAGREHWVVGEPNLLIESVRKLKSRLWNYGGWWILWSKCTLVLWYIMNIIWVSKVPKKSYSHKSMDHSPTVKAIENPTQPHLLRWSNGMINHDPTMGHLKMFHDHVKSFKARKVRAKI